MHVLLKASHSDRGRLLGVGASDPQQQQTSQDRENVQLRLLVRAFLQRAEMEAEKSTSNSECSKNLQHSLASSMQKALFLSVVGFSSCCSVALGRKHIDPGQHERPCLRCTTPETVQA